MSDAVQPLAETAASRRILEAAGVVFSRYGYRRASMDAVAAEAGFSRQGLYRHYSSKDDLFIAVAGEMHRGAAQAGEAALAETRAAGASPAQMIAALISGRLWHYLSYVHGTPHAAELMEETNRLCGAQMMESERLARDALIALITGQAEAGRLTLAAPMTGEELADLLIIAGRGAKTVTPMPQRAVFQRTLGQLVRLIIAGAAISDRSQPAEIEQAGE